MIAGGSSPNSTTALFVLMYYLPKQLLEHSLVSTISLLLNISNHMVKIPFLRQLLMFNMHHSVELYIFVASSIYFETYQEIRY